MYKQASHSTLVRIICIWASKFVIVLSQLLVFRLSHGPKSLHSNPLNVGCVSHVLSAQPTVTVNYPNSLIGLRAAFASPLDLSFNTDIIKSTLDFETSRCQMIMFMITYLDFPCLA